MLLSHPGKLLLDHLKNVFLIGDCILMQKKTEFESFSEHDIRQLNKLNLLTHDLGKATSYFQDYIRNLDDNTQRMMKGKGTVFCQGFVL